jgi:DNA polymerase elongation subunit (family B)
MTSTKKIIGKSFRLIDFHTYDSTNSSGNDSSDNDSVNSSKSSNSTSNESSTENFYIQMFGLNEAGDTCSITVNDFQPFFYIKVGDNWDQGNATGLLSCLKNKVKFHAKSILSCKIVDHNKLYGFTGGKKSRFCLITFNNLTAFNKVKNLWYEYDAETNQRKSKPFIFERVKLLLYESNIPPVLRYFHIQNISPSGWVFIQTNKCEQIAKKTTTCKFEYTCSFKYIKAQSDKETLVPYKICSFDIEASSSHGDFPLPKKTYKRLATNMIDIFQKQPKTVKENNVRIQQLLTKIIITAFGYDKFDDVDIVYPKEQPTKEEVKTLSKTFVEQTIDVRAKSHNTDETIEQLFEKMKEQIKQSDNEYNTADGEAADDDSDAEEPEMNVKKQISRPTQKKTNANQMSIIDVLLNDEYTRDDMIQYINRFFINANFPKLKGDEVTFIGSTFLKYGEKEPYLNHCLVVGSCDKVSGSIIESVDTERNIILKWAELIQTENPDIIIGYNIFGFDYEFMFQRAQENSCATQFLQLSRKMGYSPKVYDKINEKLVSALENTKIQIASGEYDLRYPKMMGRLQIDMYAYFRRDFNLSSYKLDDVAGQFISDSIKKIIVSDNTTMLYSKNLAGLNVDDFIHIKINGFSSDYYNNGEKFKVIAINYNVEVEEEYKGEMKTNKYNIITIDGAQDIITTGSLEWAMTKDDVTPQDIFRLSKGSSADRAIVAKYCIQDCNLVHHLMNKIDVITGYVEMSRICSVPISYLVFRGQGIKLTSYVAKKCREKDTLMPDLDKSGSGDGYEGAIVLPPKCAMYIDNPVACVDYSSLYPSSMISQNYSHDSKVWSKEYDLHGNLIKETGQKDKNDNYIYDNLPGYEYINIEFDTYKYLRPVGKPKSKEVKTKVGKKICRWAQLPNNQKSIMPSILEELLKARSDTRKKAKTEPDPFMQNILDKRQLGYKVTANSLYGQCGARTSTFYEQDVAASTTATGRMMITYAKRIIEEVYGDLVYDTAIHGPVKCKAEYVYGDSVANYTPIKVRQSNGPVIICSIEYLAQKFGNNNWITCEEPGKQTKEYCEIHNIESWTETGWTKLYRVIRHKLHSSKKMFRIQTNTGLVDVTDDHSLLNPNGNEISPTECDLGTELLHCALSRENAITSDMSNMHTYKTNEYISSNHEYLAKLAATIPPEKSFIISEIDDTNTFRLKITSAYSPTNKITHIREIKYTGGYVYDLTTENHHFSAGIGDLIVHNTDSVFFTFNLENPNTGEKIRGKAALEMTIEIAQDAADLCTQFLKPPMALTYEKTLMPFLLLSKKRYVGMLYEEDPNKGKLKYMGLVLKRRDNCDLVKDIYGGVLNCLMNNSNIQPAIDFLNNSLNELIQGKVSMDKLAITKSLRSDYKNPQQISHRVLADRIGQRDPGNKPKPGDRIKYLFIVNKNAKLQGDKIETPEFIIANHLKIDYTYYITNQLMKPLQQLFGLAIEQIWTLQNKTSAIKTFKKDIGQMKLDTDGDLEAFMKKREKYTSSKIKVLLFDKFLTKIYNEQNGVRTIADCFK